MNHRYIQRGDQPGGEQTRRQTSQGANKPGGEPAKRRKSHNSDEQMRSISVGGESDV